jgi:hypothetical protein
MPSENNTIITKHKFLTIILATMLAACLFYIVMPVVVHSVRPNLCGGWENRPVQIEPIKYSDIEILRKTTTVVHFPRMLATVLPARGISVPGVVAVIDNIDTKAREYLLIHEMVHQYQYKRDGKFAFMLKYTVDFHRGLIRGCSFSKAYRAIYYEIEADEVAHYAVVSRCNVSIWC